MPQSTSLRRNLKIVKHITGSDGGRASGRLFEFPRCRSLGNAVSYFNPRKPSDLATKVSQVLDDPSFSLSLERAATRASNYNWEPQPRPWKILQSLYQEVSGPMVRILFSVVFCKILSIIKYETGIRTVSKANYPWRFDGYSLLGGGVKRSPERGDSCPVNAARQRRVHSACLHFLFRPVGQRAGPYTVGGFDVVCLRPSPVTVGLGLVMKAVKEHRCYCGYRICLRLCRPLGR